MADGEEDRGRHARRDPDVPGGVLPDRVRRLVVDLAADVLGALTEPEVPVSLRRVRSFAPVRRSRAGAAPLGVALERDGAFRQVVASGWRQRHPELSAAIEAGETPAAADPVAAAAGVWLSRPPGWEQSLAVWLSAVEEAGAAARAHESAEAAEAGVAAAQREAGHWRGIAEAADAERAELAEELAQLRRELRRHRADADRARAAARAAEAELAVERERAAGELAARDDAARSAQARAREAEEQAAEARRSGREGRVAADTRARLLLDTILDAASGLRRELALPPAGPPPADRIAAELADVAGPAPAPGPGPRARDADDPAALDELLRLPRAHLVVDGYNVTKTGWASLPLAEQRRRLVDGLGPVAARTGAEVTCCFDGADVESRGPARVRGVRVLFSEPGVTADELIRRLVRAEPEGRVVVVVSSDGEVASGVTASGARAVPAAALVRLLGRAG